MILAIDPGPVESAYVRMDETYEHWIFGKVPNDEMLQKVDIYARCSSPIVIEMIASYGMAVGKEVFDTCVWIGRFTQAAIMAGAKVEYVYRKDVKLNICSSPKANDSNIRKALIDRFGPVGTKKSPGWFYGFKADIWAAYAVGVTYMDSHDMK